MSHISAINRFLKSSQLLRRHLCSTNPNPNHQRGRTPLEKQFDSWVQKLKPGFNSDDVADVIRSQSDPDLALDLFRWSALRPGYKHTAVAYHAMLQVSSENRRFSVAETLADEILAGACDADLPLFNAAIRFCCSRRNLFSRAFDLFKKMGNRPSSQCRPTLETYTMLLSAVLRRFGKPPVCYVYLHTIRSLVKQMKSSGVIPDTFVLNLVIKAFSKCLEMDEALRVFREFGIYCCEPNEYSYGYLVKGLCEKGRIDEGMSYFREMREKGLVPKSSVYMAVICSVVLERNFDLGIDVMYDMLENKMSPDLLTYRTVLEGLCREGKSDSAFELLEELSKRKGALDRKMYADLLEGLHWLCQPH